MEVVKAEENAPSTSAPEAPTDKANVVIMKTRLQGPFGPEQTFYLVGTSHVSKKSVEDVRQLIRAVKPQIVMLELCQQRTATLNKVDRNQLQERSFSQHLALWRQGKEPLLAVVYSWMLSSVADKCEIVPGEEFRVALEEASKIGAKIALGDRLVSITIARTWAALSLWQKLKFIGEMLWVGLLVPGKEVNALMDSLTGDTDVLTEAIREFGQAYPSIIRTLIEERDEYMVCMLRHLASQASKVVAVVGAGHLQGLQEKWEADVDIEELTRMPTSSKARRWRNLVLIATAGSVVVASVTVAVQWRRRQ